VSAVRGIVALLLLWAYRLGRCALALLALAHAFGSSWAILLVLVLLVVRLTWGIRLAAMAGLMLLWHWPWWVALPVAAPRLLLVLPGLSRWGLARLRHPRPRWSAPPLPEPP